MELQITNYSLCRGLYGFFLTLAFSFCICQPIFSQIKVNITSTNIGCGSGNTGSATASATGGWPPYTYLWSNGATTPTITGLGVGTYTVTVTDVDLAFATASVTITAGNNLGVSAFGESQICDVFPDGKATAVPFGGTPPYTYKWNTGATTAQITGLNSGTYTVTVTDATGCTAAASTQVFFWDEGLWIMLMVKSDITCFGANDGKLVTQVMSGTPPFTYAWSTGTVFTTPNLEHVISGLSPGNYSVTVTDVNGCTHSQSLTLTQPAALQANVTSTPASCSNTGSVTVNPSGGTPPYSIIWGNGSTNFTLSNLAPGTYTATLKDAKQCSTPVQATVSGSNVSLQVTATVTKLATCTGGGTANASASGGSGNYTFAWSNGQIGGTATNLTAGVYTVTAVDAISGCTGTASVQMTQTANPVANISIVTQATCTTGATATVHVIGGTPPYTYQWSNGQTTLAATNLPVGTASVVVTDAGGCKTTSTVNITAPASPNVTVTVISNATCLTGGSATATATGGAGGYVYLWSNNQTTPTATNLPAGTHQVTVTDAAGCSRVGSVTIAQTQGPNATATLTQVATCLTGGVAKVTATGGQTPYSYLWDNGQTTATANNLAVGTRSVTVTDANGCKAIATVQVTRSPNPTVQVSIVQSATCSAGGRATATPSGGTGGYTYAWSNGQTSATAINLTGPATYTVTVTDNGGCTVTASIQMPAPPRPTAIISASSNATCDAGGSATVLAAGGTPPYTYLWTTGANTATASNLPSGNYVVTVTDAGGCTVSASVNIGFTNNGIKIGDFVWIDQNQNGVQDATETQGVANINVKLIRPGPDGVFGTPDDVVVGNTNTNAQGKYEFDCVLPGTYILAFSGIPAGYEYTQKDKGSDCTDSDVNPNGRTDPFTILAGQPNNFCFDAGIHTICQNVTMAGIICCDQTICEGQIPATLYNVMSAGGGSGQLQYLWLRLDNVGPAGPQWVGTGVTTENFVFTGPLFKTTSYMRCARRAGCDPFLETNIVTITVKPAGSVGCPPFNSNLTVVPTSPTTVAVSWTTGPEVIPFVYTVQHSQNKLTWKNIASVMGKMDANTNSYTVEHQQPMSGKSYYRIQRTDLEDISVYSDIFTLNLNIPLQESIQINPNPVSNTLYVKNLMTYPNQVDIQIFSATGNLLYILPIPPGEVKNFELSLSHLPSGVYFAKVLFSDSEVKTLKLVKN